METTGNAWLDSLDVNYVELHGIGTQAGDPVEIRSITNVIAPNHGQRRRSDQPLRIGAVKANVGHGAAGAGVTTLMKILCMLRKNAIPPHVDIKISLNSLFPTNLDTIVLVLNNGTREIRNLSPAQQQQP